MNFVILAIESLDILCDLALKATGHDNSKEEIESLINKIRNEVKPYNIPPPEETK
jgi:hypothetical protein